ncbi:fimbria/pilus outer membrane usher protein [Cupriavidus basilensis]|uniref:fimbria/pilus outer membrane usher protein n=1 Tax=Cupriavidus basilensis TaxID=68895 RepID=UPI000751587C|nr:fimbria/pilus outer membrane usher protein [Cupriavidus basilensis]
MRPDISNRTRNTLSTQRTPLCLALLVLFGMGGAWAAPTPANAAAAAPMTVASVEFNDDFLVRQGGHKADLSRYQHGNPVLPGEYRAELTVNGQLLGYTDVQVKAGGEPGGARVCVTLAQLDQFGVDMSKVDAGVVAALAAPGACLTLPEIVPHATATLDPGQLRLEVSIPQDMARRTPRGYVNPALWDSGVTAGFLGYGLNVYRSESGGHAATSGFLSLNAGFNLGEWYFRHNGSLSTQAGAGSKYQNVNTYVQKDLTALQSRLVLGGANTSGELFDTLPFLGAQVASDDRMLPDSQRGYAPVVRGVADTNARVTIRQNGVVIYDTPVAPGPFAIDDLYPSGYGGDLQVTVTEADGRERTFTVPYAAVPMLLRPGMTRFSVTAGVLNDTTLSSRPKLLQATVQRGLTNSLTGYAGVQASNRYAAVLAGAAFDTGFGAVSMDVTGAYARIGGQTFAGTSTRLAYSKLFQQTGSNLSVATYRFSSDRYVDFAGAARMEEAARSGQDISAMHRPKSRATVSLSQPLPRGWGQVFASALAQDYWNGKPHDVQYQLGYSNRIGPVNYSVTATRVRGANGTVDNQFMLNLTLPLGRASRAPQLAFSLGHETGGGTSAQTTVSGVAGADNQFSYGVTAARSAAGQVSGALNGQYRTPYTSIQAAYGQGSGYRNASVGLSGSVVAHPGGVSFSPYTGDTFAVVEAPAAAGARIDSYPGLVLDGRGYGVVPYLMPYRQNQVSLDPANIPDDIELKVTSQQVAPRAGAVVMLRYATESGQAALIDAALADGTPVPFGAEVTDGDGNNAGLVGQGGRIYVRLKEGGGALTARWGDGAGQQCEIEPAADAQGSSPLLRLKRVCTVG